MIENNKINNILTLHKAKTSSLNCSLEEIVSLKYSANIFNLENILNFYFVMTTNIVTLKSLISEKC